MRTRVIKSNWLLYEDGRAYSLITHKFLKVRKHTGGYGRYSLGRKDFYIHRLVATAFIPNPDNNPEVNHKDGVKLNNNAYNLEWVTKKGNMAHAAKQGLTAWGSKQWNSKLSELDVLWIRGWAKQGFSNYEISNIFAVEQEQVRRIITKDRWANLA